MPSDILLAARPIVSLQITTVPDLCCIVTWRLVESVGGVFDPVKVQLCYGHAASLVWMQQSLSVTTAPALCKIKKFYKDQASSQEVRLLACS